MSELGKEEPTMERDGAQDLRSLGLGEGSTWSFLDSRCRDLGVVEMGRSDVLAFHRLVDILLFFVESKNFRVKLYLRDIRVSDINLLLVTVLLFGENRDPLPREMHTQCIHTHTS